MDSENLCASTITAVALAALRGAGRRRAGAGGGSFVAAAEEGHGLASAAGAVVVVAEGRRPCGAQPGSIASCERRPVSRRRSAGGGSVVVRSLCWGTRSSTPVALWDTEGKERLAAAKDTGGNVSNWPQVRQRRGRQIRGRPRDSDPEWTSPQHQPASQVDSGSRWYI